MTKRSIELAALALALTVAGGCKGRKASWEEKDTKTPTTSGADAAKDGAAAAATLEAGNAAWEARGQGKAKILEAISNWEGALGCAPGDTKPDDRCRNDKVDAALTAENAPLLALVTRAYYFYADGYLRGDDKAYLDYMERSVWWGDRALVAASPEFAQKMRDKGKYHEVITTVGIEALPAMYWRATALGKWARASGFGVLVGQKDNIKATMERALELDENFYHGGPHRYFGAFYAVAPGFAGGDTTKSQEHYDKALGIAPYFIGTKVLMAENLATKLDDEEMFDRLLAEVLAADLSAVPPEVLPELTIEQEKARELMKQKDDEGWF